MQTSLNEIVYDIQLQAGEPLTLPPQAGKIVGPGNWRISIAPVPLTVVPGQVRGHNAFLESYAAEDEGLYDDDSAG